MSLALNSGAVVNLIASGDDEEEAVEALANFVQKKD